MEETEEENDAGRGYAEEKEEESVEEGDGGRRKESCLSGRMTQEEVMCMQEKDAGRDDQEEKDAGRGDAQEGVIWRRRRRRRLVRVPAGAPPCLPDLAKQ